MTVENNTHWLKKEIENWKTQGIINKYQSQKIQSLYGFAIPPQEPEKDEKPSQIITIILILGALLIGIGTILLVASNWKIIPDAIKLILLFATTFTTYYIGWKLTYDTKSSPKLGHALIFLASIFVGVTIFLTAQIFHVNANAPSLIFLWFLAISPMGYAFNSKYILGLNIFTFTLWMITCISNTRGLFLSTFEVFILFMSFGISLYGLGELHAKIKKYSNFRLTYQGVGLFFILTSYYYFSLETPYTQVLGKISTPDWTIQALFAVFGITALATVILSIPKSNQINTSKHEFYILLLAFLGWISTLTLAFFSESLTITTTTDYGYTHTTLDPQISTILFIIFNLIFFILSIGSILIGYYKRTTPFVNIGIFFFVLGTLHLYFTTIYELLPRSLAFITSGLILMGGGWYLEKKRRTLIKDIEANRYE